MSLNNKILIILIIGISFILSNLNLKVNSEDVTEKLRAGTFLKVVPTDEISTLTADIDDEYKFISIADMYVYETNAIPQNTVFYGRVEDVLEPVTGRDGALKIEIYKIITPEEKVYKVKGHIYSENDNYIGGKQTAPVVYRKVPHYNNILRPYLKMAPLNIYAMGEHTIIKPGSEIFVILDEDIILK